MLTTQQQQRQQLLIAVTGVMAVTAGWFAFLRIKDRATSTVWVIVLLVLVAVVITQLILGLVLIPRQHMTPARFVRISTNFVLTLLFVALLFSLLYWNYGTSRNFDHSLTHLDAIYFTLGTLTTAGTGNINATSDVARGIQLAQMTMDLALLVFAITLLMARWSQIKENNRTGNDNSPTP